MTFEEVYHMDYVYRFLLSGLMLILSGFMFGTVFWSRRERKFREKEDAARDELTEPEFGRWVAEWDRNGHYSHCSKCGCRCQGYAPNYRYCPGCGAEMRGLDAR